MGLVYIFGVGILVLGLIKLVIVLIYFWFKCFNFIWDNFLGLIVMLFLVFLKGKLIIVYLKVI